ncbi:MAG: exo-rhamnogalacturonan lyase family protein [Candidatus Zipacnadales bacterium]
MGYQVWSLLLSIGCGLVYAQDTQDLSPEVQQRLGLAPGGLGRLISVSTSPDEAYTAAQAIVNAPDILSLEAGHIGGQRLLFRIGFAAPPDFNGATFIIYLDLDNNPATGRKDPQHVGIDLMAVIQDDQVSSSFHNAAYSDNNTILRAARVGKALYVTVDAPLPEKDPIAVGVHLLSQRGQGRSDSTPHQVAQLPRSGAKPAPLAPGRESDLRTLDDYRYHDDLVKYEKLEDKGLRAEQVAPVKPFSPARRCPRPLFASTGREPDKGETLSPTLVPVSLLEESGVARSATPISFGFPCPEGGIFDPARLRVLDVKKREIPAQFTVTAFWPDGSLKWVLVDFLTALQPGAEQIYTVELGRDVQRSLPASPLTIAETDDQLTIMTGPLQVVIDKERFSIFRQVARDVNGDGSFDPNEQVLTPTPEGMVLTDEHGKAFTSAGVPPDEILLEERGPLKAVVRVEGRYAAADGGTYMRYIARLTFRAGSSRVAVTWTHLNDYLATEFTDFTSLRFPLRLNGGLRQTTVFLTDADGKLQGQDYREFSLFQADEAHSIFEVPGQKALDSGRGTGLLRCVGGAGPLTMVLHDFWQRWPKGLSANAQQVSIDLLPPQPGPDYGTNLPHYLLFNLVSGKYRLKWGMAFTEHFTLDFDPQTASEELYADTNHPVVPVLPAEWYASTAALGPLAAPREQQFAVWDKYVADSFAAYMARKANTREYGFLNYGDWYGERGRNWGNNEYDLAHGLFQQFLRTGNRDYFRWALVAARHQADVDIIHAYPDPFYVGGNVPHSVGHTGAWSERLTHGTWHTRYDAMVTAANGHNWADGMVDAWCLTGDATVMESALQLAEHVTWAMSPTFTTLGTHERTAGWALKTILAVYRQTYDPEYIAAARRIAAVPLAEQKFEQGGAWPHILPLDHSNQQPNVMGNNLFLIGILLGGLQAYHEVAPEPAVEKSLIAGVQWVAKSWDETASGWPYSATPEGQPLYPPSTSLNMLIIQPLAYVAHLTNDERLWHIVEDSLTAVCLSGPQSFGKSLAQQLHFAGGTLALLQEHYEATRPDQGLSVLSGDPAWYAGIMAKTPDATRHSVRAPDEKIFFVRPSSPETELIAERVPHGARPKVAPTGTLRVLAADGTVVGEDTFSTDSSHEYRLRLPGPPGATFKVAINDDQRGVWTLRGDHLQIVMQTIPGFSIGGIGKSKYHFFVPAGTERFRMRLFGVHTGPYGAVVLTPEGHIAGQHQATNPGTSSDKPSLSDHPERGEIVVEPAAADTNKLWSVVLWAAGDLGVELVGIPPYLSLTAQAWFDPTR